MVTLFIARLGDTLGTDKEVIANVYFMACERNHSRPLPDGASALWASGVLANVTGSTNQRRHSMQQPRVLSHGSQSADVLIAMRGTGLDDKGLDAFIETLTQKCSDFGGGGIHHRRQ